MREPAHWSTFTMCSAHYFVRIAAGPNFLPTDRLLQVELVRKTSSRLLSSTTRSNLPRVVENSPGPRIIWDQPGVIRVTSSESRGRAEVSLEPRMSIRARYPSKCHPGPDHHRSIQRDLIMLPRCNGLHVTVALLLLVTTRPLSVQAFQSVPQARTCVSVVDNPDRERETVAPRPAQPSDRSGSAVGAVEAESWQEDLLKQAVREARQKQGVGK
jgi:hypothetical protein